MHGMCACDNKQVQVKTRETTLTQLRVHVSMMQSFHQRETTTPSIRYINVVTANVTFMSVPKCFFCFMGCVIAGMP